LKNLNLESICIVIPAYNEGLRLPILQFEQFIEQNSICFCFINDGSIDNTETLLKQLRADFPNKILVVSNSINKGKAESVRVGINEALKWKPFKYVGYFDADLATPLNEIYNLLDALDNSSKYRFALGTRLNRLGAEIKRNQFRHYVGRIFATIASIVLKMPVYDSQCGAKLIESDLAKDIFNEPFYSKWLFDVELLARVRNSYSTEILIEVPLKKWEEIGKTKITKRDLFVLPFEFYKISKKYNHQ